MMHRLKFVTASYKKKLKVVYIQVVYMSQYQFSSKLLTILNFAMKYVYKPVFYDLDR